MRPRHRLAYYLVLNVIVSALVTGTIIFFYDRAHQAECNTVPVVIPTIPTDGDAVKVTITGVIGAGTLADERIAIQNDGNQELDLAGWYLKDDKGVTYVFPQLTLYAGAKVQVHTAAGDDLLPDLYWGRDAPLWASGELAALYDSHNIARAFYRVP